MIYWQNPLLSGSILLASLAVFFFPSLLSLSWVCYILLVWIGANTAFHFAMRGLSHFKIVSQPENPHAHMLLAHFLREKNFPGQFITKGAEQLSKYLEEGKALLLLALECKSLKVTFGSIAALYAAVSLISLMGDWNVVFLCIFAAMTLPLLSVIFDDELAVAQEIATTKLKTIGKSAIDSVPPAAKKYIPSFVTDFVNNKKNE